MPHVGWVEFVVGSCPFSRVFLWVLRFSLDTTNNSTDISKFQLIRKQWTVNTLCGCATLNSYLFSFSDLIKVKSYLQRFCFLLILCFLLFQNVSATIMLIAAIITRLLTMEFVITATTTPQDCYVNSVWRSSIAT